MIELSASCRLLGQCHLILGYQLEKDHLDAWIRDLIGPPQDMPMELSNL
jgi:hypothetical protein